MDWLAAPDYWLARLIFQRLLAAIYLIGFLVALDQFRPLLGERGLLPAPDFIRQVPFTRGAADHQRSHLQESGPQFSNCAHDRLQSSPGAGSEVLIEDEKSVNFGVINK